MKPIVIKTEQEMMAFGENLAKRLAGKSCLIYLQGDLGAGKTCLVRGFLKGMGHHGTVKSPTYTLVEPYELNDKTVYHFDLYRIHDQEELEYIGIREYLSSDAICLIEWPEKAQGLLPKADIHIVIRHQQNQREVVLRDAKNLL